MKTVWISLVAGLSAIGLQAATIVLQFPSTTSIEQGPGCGGPGAPGTLGGCFITGDNITQTFTATGLASTASSNWVFTIADSTSGTTTNDFAALINGKQVGTFAETGSSDGTETDRPFNLNFNYAPISGPNYTLEILATSTVPPGFSSWDVRTSGNVTLNSPSVVSPEPESLLLVGAALMLLGAYRSRSPRRGLAR